MDTILHRLRGKLEVDTEFGSFLGDTRIRLLEAIAAGGSTISDYRSAYGKSGIFQDSFEVYGKKGEPCPSCGRALKAERIAGRTSTHCPGCQKLYQAGAGLG